MARRARRRTHSVGLGGVLVFVGATVGVLALLYAGYRYLQPASGSGGDETRAPVAQPAAGAAIPPAPPAPASPGATPAGPRGELPSEPEPYGDRAHERPSVPLGGPPPEPRPVRGEAYVALVIDDLGRSLEQVASLGRLGVPLSYAVLPFETRTGEVVAALAERREEILLHLPMEGSPGADPGPGALSVGMRSEELDLRTREALDAVPGARGVNNHMGSVLTADRRAMRVVLDVLAERGLFFLDSRTSPETVAYAVARDRGVPAAERNVFLDPDPDPEAIRGQFWRLLDLARREGSGIAIGHPYDSTMSVLEEEVPRARELGYTFVVVSDLLDRPGELY